MRSYRNAVCALILAPILAALWGFIPAGVAMLAAYLLQPKKRKESNNAN